MVNRIRNVQLKINLTEEEKALFEKKMNMAKCKTMNHFLRKVVSESDIYVVDLQPFREIQGLLFRYASSVNQIAKRVNSTGVIYSDDIKDMQSQIEHLSKEIWQIHSLLLNKTTNKGDDI
ncbi:plasmid mobilization protein [Streptococcus constellatus]|uniref:plasmid mobilization protein n=1 Tax=Streptococcus constellatus TaxID=76860 RepID=UPI00066BCA26|nr:plasmid mobilization relaxosome protein MobC [Streptococcus constellatus]